MAVRCPVGQDSRIGVVRCVPVGLPSWNVKMFLDMQLDTQRSHR